MDGFKLPLRPHDTPRFSHAGQPEFHQSGAGACGTWPELGREVQLRLRLCSAHTVERHYIFHSVLLNVCACAMGLNQIQMRHNIINHRFSAVCTRTRMHQSPSPFCRACAAGAIPFRVYPYTACTRVVVLLTVGTKFPVTDCVRAYLCVTLSKACRPHARRSEIRVWLVARDLSHGAPSEMHKWFSDTQSGKDESEPFYVRGFFNRILIDYTTFC